MATTLQAVCYTVENGAIVAGTLADFDSFIETTTRPHGVGTKYYAVETRGGWALAKWATWGGPQQIVREFDTQAEAEAAAEETWVYDILNNSEIVIHLDRAGAEQELAQLIAE